MSNPWELSPSEHQANRGQFLAAGAINGKLSGQAARNVLLKSNLPSTTLGQIWNLSDLDKDGQLDEREFSIAMKLARNCLSGLAIPPQLPPSMINVGSVSSIPMHTMNSSTINSMSMSPPTMGMGSMGMSPMHQSTPYQQQTYNTAPAAVLQAALHSGQSQGPYTQGRQCGNWSIPQQKRLHYCQNFNQLDQQRNGILAGNVARNAMGQSGLSMPTLAHIWNLSDVNKDGRLNVDEFCIASHLIEMHKNGYALPDVTPPELAQLCGIDRNQSQSPQLEPGAPPPQKVTSPKTFEDKRRDNYDKGQAELERRRQLLREEEDRRRAEIEKREREEAERKERERQEQERRREEQRRIEMEKQRILEEQRRKEEEKREAEREQLRKESEKQRMIEMEKLRVKELQTMKQQESERTAQRQQRQKTLGFQLQALDEKAVETNDQITKARNRIEEITREIEGMRGDRDQKMQRINQLQNNHQQLSVQSQELAHALLQMQSANRETSDQLIELEQCQKNRDIVRGKVVELKEEVEKARGRTQTQKGLVQQKQQEMENSKATVEKERADYSKALKLLQNLQMEARAKVAEKDAVLSRQIEEEREKEAEQLRREQKAAAEAAFAAFPPTQPSADSSFVVHNHVQSHTAPSGGSSGVNPLPTHSTSGTAKYRAKFEFVSRTEDELSFQEGDLVLVFEGHAAEPGWLAGQIRDKVGWFPAAFAEPIAPVNTNITQPIQSASDVTPSPSLEKIVEEPSESVHAPLSHTLQSTVSPSASMNTLCTCTAQFPWKARNEGDLSFAKGDIIEVIEKHEMKWRGRKGDGTVGWFPKSYVKVVEEHSPKGPTSVSGPVHAVVNDAPMYDAPPGDIPTSGSHHSVSNSSHVAPSATYDTPPGPDTTAPMYDAPPGDIPASNSIRSLAEAAWPSSAPSAQPSGEWFIALFDFDAIESTDLPLKIGDRILVIEQSEQWWKGVSNGREGVFPANYVQKATGEGHGADASHFHGIEHGRAVTDFVASADNQLSLKMGEMVTIRSKSEQGWWEGEVVRDGNTISGWFPGNYVAVENPSNPASSDVDVVVALFDYEASQHDELSFKIGDKIVVSGRADTEWWTGHKQDSPSHHGLFPSAYVQIGSPEESLSNASQSSNAIDRQRNEKLKKLTEELLSTEDRYLSDLLLARRLFHHNLKSVVSDNDMKTITLNWEELIALSQRIRDKMRQGQRVGSLFLSEIDGLQSFVSFCSRQQMAFDTLNNLLKEPSIRNVYNQCCTSEHARGMSLNYFILLPLGRITRYPLLIEKMIANSLPSDGDTPALDMSLSVMKTLVEEINRQITEIDNVSMLFWCQQHIKSPIQPPIEYSSETRLQGPRKFLHSGILYKARSGKLLIVILFNDFLLMTTPDEQIHDVNGFKLSRTTDHSFSIYKSPLLLSHLLLVKDPEEAHFSLKYGEDTIQLRSANVNSCRLWINQLQQAVDNCAIEMAEIARRPSTISDHQPCGRLLVEIVSLENIDSKIGGKEAQLVCRLNVHKDTQLFDVDMSKTELKFTTQFVFDEVSGDFRLGIFHKRIYAPDVLVYDEVQLPLRELVNEGSMHRGPIRRAIALTRGSKNGTRKAKESVILKFVVQMFDNDL